MSVVWVTQGVHFNLPGLPVTVHKTMEGADMAARILTDAMLRAADMRTAQRGWERDLARLRRLYDDSDLNVWITITELVE